MLLRYFIHAIDLRLENGWPGKSAYLFYLDLIGDVVNMTIFLVFMLTFFIQNPSRLPIYMMADVIQVARQLAQRLKSFRRYRQITKNMDLRVKDASDDEIESADACISCRDTTTERRPVWPHTSGSPPHRPAGCPLPGCPGLPWPRAF